MNTPTPETDALARAGAYMKDGDYSSTQGKQFVHIDDARKLEQERDEARAELQLQLNSIKEYDYHYGLHVTERDQLRKVCDELFLTSEMLMTVVCNSSGGDWRKETVDWQNAARRYVDEYYERLKLYNSLPHVIAAKKGES